MYSYRLARFFLCLLLVFAAGHNLRANLLTNGDFETTGGGETFNGGYATVGAGTLIPGWTTALGNGSSPGVYHSSTGSSASWIPNPESGNYCIQLDSTSTAGPWTTGSSVSTTYNVSAGTVYSLSFWICTEVSTGKGGTSGIDVNITNGANTYYSTVSGSTPFTNTNPADVTRGAATWSQYTINFTASQYGVTTFTFADDPLSANSNISIDNVDLEIATVPEPSQWASAVLIGASILAVVRKFRWHTRFFTLSRIQPRA